MKSESDVKSARSAVCKAIATPGISEQQLVLLRGMSVALCWCAGDPNGSSLQRLIDGEPILPANAVMDALRKRN